jgi:probable F420-dependent oxidoreductase
MVSSATGFARPQERPMPRPIRIGVQLQPQHATYAAIREAVLRAEDLGADAVFNWDHFYPLSGDPDGLHFECWTMLGAWAQQTERVQIGALVSGGGYRNPDLLADMARTVDHLSDGRLILGIGAGWFEKDYQEYGYEFGTPGTRLKLLGEYLPRVTERLTKLNPQPVRKIPMLIGGGGERKTLRYVAQYADIWHAFGDPETLHRKSEILAGHCTAVGRDITEIEKSTALPKHDEATADALADDGFTLLTISASGPDYDLDIVADAIRWRDLRNARRQS